MVLRTSQRGFRLLLHDSYANEPVQERLLQESSAIGDYEDSFDKPGSSFLWVDEHFHLNREEVRELIQHMQTWLDTGRLCGEAPEAPTP